jgi:hypothetical protein
MTWDQLTFLVLASPANPSVSPDDDAVRTTTAGSGLRYRASFAAYDHATSCWRTFRGFAAKALELFSETWPRAGMTRNGIAYLRPPSAPLTGGTVSGLWPTPVAHDDGNTPEAHMAMKARMPGGPRQTITSLTVMVKAIERGLWPTPRSTDGDRGGRGDLIQAIRGNPNSHYRLWPTPTANRWDGLQSHGKNIITGQLNPTWVEWLMGYPADWTFLED